MNRIIFVIPIFLFLASCGNEIYIYSEKKAVNPAGWAYADSLDFNFEMKDTSLVYSILLDIDHSTDYPYQNIYFNMIIEEVKCCYDASGQDQDRYSFIPISYLSGFGKTIAETCDSGIVIDKVYWIKTVECILRRFKQGNNTGLQ